MLKRSKLVAALFSSLVLIPVLAAGRPACCVTAPAAQAVSRGCCAAMSGAQASAPKGCCKAPAAPKTDTKANNGAPIALPISALTLGAPELTPVAIPEAVSTRLARRAHHAEQPDDTPPDILSHIHVLLI